MMQQYESEKKFLKKIFSLFYVIDNFCNIQKKKLSLTENNFFKVIQAKIKDFII